MNYLIGSRALNYWLGIESNPNSDWDVVSDSAIIGTEWHDPDFLNNGKICEYYASGNTTTFEGNILTVVSLQGLAIIKRSHLWRTLGFGKHITHYHKLGLVNHFQNNDLYRERLEMSYVAFKQQHPNLNQSVKDFFDDAVTKKYDHDWLHEVVAYYDKPLYTKLQKDSSKAFCDKDLWYNLSHQDKIKCIAEETKVIAIERFLVPNDWKYPSKLAYIKALEKVCTTLCSSWFRDFAIDNYPRILGQYCSEDFKKYELAITNKRI